MTLKKGRKREKIQRNYKLHKIYEEKTKKTRCKTQIHRNEL